ncbi:MAG: hypothetical protein Q9195_002594 [Heterodermia aff. obscurata]
MVAETALYDALKVSQAYEILSDPEKRKVYDQYGLEYLLRGGTEAPPRGGAGPGGMPFESMPGGVGGMGGMPGGGRSFHYSTGGGAGGFNFSSADSIFEQFFKAGGANMGDDDDIFSQFSGGRGGGRSTAKYGDSNGRRRHRQPSPEITIVEKPLHVTLEELYNGASKKLKIKRKTFDPRTNKRNDEEKVLDMTVKPGWKAGTKIKFKGVGDQEEGGTQDMHFIVTEKPHNAFKREDDNLRHVIELDLKEALTGWSRTIGTIDGKQVPASGGGPTYPGYVITFPHLGMPKSKKPSERGDMLVEVKVKFPSSLTAAQKSHLKEIL